MLPSDMMSGGSCNDINSKGMLNGLEGDVEGAHIGHIMEMGPITNDEINQMEEIAITTACGGDVDIETAAERIGQLTFVYLYSIQKSGLLFIIKINAHLIY